MSGFGEQEDIGNEGNSKVAQANEKKSLRDLPSSSLGVSSCPKCHYVFCKNKADYYRVAYSGTKVFTCRTHMEWENEKPQKRLKR